MKRNRAGEAGGRRTPPVVLKRRCAVYTRKSSEEGLEQEFNSLDAQRESCEAYVAAQKGEGWLLVDDRYDDGGFSGGTLDRPALKRLMADIEAGRVNIVVVYKIDRLSRSLMDFAKLVEVFDRKNVTFVSVTQSFNTTTSMGRLTLNVLLSFAQFEREVIGFVNKYGQRLDKGRIYKLLNNRVYVGDAVHKGTAYPGEHEAVVSLTLWDRVQAIFAESCRTRTGRTRAQTPALLKGLIFGPTGHAMVPTHTRRRGRLYRYYVSSAVLKQGRDACPIGRISAGEIEAAVIGQVRQLLATPEIIVQTWRAARAHHDTITEAEVRAALLDLDPLWSELFPAEQARIIHLLVERIDLTTQGAEIRLRTAGLASLAHEMTTTRKAA